MVKAVFAIVTNNVVPASISTNVWGCWYTMCVPMWCELHLRWIIGHFCQLAKAAPLSQSDRRCKNVEHIIVMLHLDSTRKNIHLKKDPDTYLPLICASAGREIPAVIKRNKKCNLLMLNNFYESCFVITGYLLELSSFSSCHWRYWCGVAAAI